MPLLTHVDMCDIMTVRHLADTHAEHGSSNRRIGQVTTTTTLVECLYTTDVDTPDRRTLAEELIEAAEHDGLHDLIARSAAARTPGVIWQRDADDVRQLVRQTHWQMALAPLSLEPGRWVACLLVRSRSATRDWASSPAHTGMSGASGVIRRQRALHAQRARLTAELGYEPTTEEVVAVVAAIQPSGRCGRRHTALPVATDLAGVSMTSLRPSDVSLAPDTADGVIARLDVERRLAAVIDRCIAADPELGRIAAAWLERWDGDRLPTIVDVARRVGRSTAMVRSAVRTIRAIWLELDEGVPA